MQSYKEKKIYFFNVDKKNSIVTIFYFIKYEKKELENQTDVMNWVFKKSLREHKNDYCWNQISYCEVTATKFKIPMYANDLIDSKWKIYERKVFFFLKINSIAQYLLTIYAIESHHACEPET